MGKKKREKVMGGGNTMMKCGKHMGKKGDIFGWSF